MNHHNIKIKDQLERNPNIEGQNSLDNSEVELLHGPLILKIPWQYKTSSISNSNIQNQSKIQLQYLTFY